MLTALVCKQAKGWVRIGLKVVPFIVIVAVAGLCLWLVLTFFWVPAAVWKLQKIACVLVFKIFISIIFFFSGCHLCGVLPCVRVCVCIIYMYIFVCVFVGLHKMMFVECLLSDATSCNWLQQLDYNRLQHLRERERMERDRKTTQCISYLWKMIQLIVHMCWLFFCRIKLL